MKRYVFLPARTVSVEDGTVRDLDGTTLGRVACWKGKWLFTLGAEGGTTSEDYGTQKSALAALLAALLADPSCPTPGPNRYDR